MRRLIPSERVALECRPDSAGLRTIAALLRRRRHPPRENEEVDALGAMASDTWIALEDRSRHPPSHSQVRVLVVDDDPTVAEMLGLVLQHEGFDPIWCDHGDQRSTRSVRPSRPWCCST